MGFYINDDYWAAVKDFSPRVQNELLGAMTRLYYTGVDQLDGISNKTIWQPASASRKLAASRIVAVSPQTKTTILRRTRGRPVSRIKTPILLKRGRGRYIPMSLTR